ncbi:MAG: hypothetical protein ACYTGV_01505 [Planctomycetota bacterium]|jgi:hypothetical protein
MPNLSDFLSPFFLLLPAAASLFVRPRPGASLDLARVRRLRKRLWIWTGVSVVAFALLRFGRTAGWFEWWLDLPRYMTWGKAPDEICWVLFFPLWFAVFMPLLVAVRPEAASPYPTGGSQRSAALSAREPLPVPRWAWLSGWALWGAAAAAVFVHLSGGGDGAGWAPASLVLLAAAPLPILCGQLTAPMLLREPEPLDAHGSRELIDAYARYRRSRAWGMFWLMWSMTVVFAAVAVLAVFEVLSQGALGWMGGVGGSLIGIFGAAFGVRSSILRMRIKARLDEIVEAERR